MKAPVPLLGLALLAGCAAQPRPVVEAAPPPPPGMELLLGAPVERATGLLGVASLDRREGPARHLQFAGACILDLYYYARGGAMIATHAEARRPDGRDVAAGECLQLLLKAQGG